MKKFLMVVLSVILLLSSFTSSVFAERKTSLFINGKEVELAASPVIKNQRTMIPFNSEFFTQAGVKTELDIETNTVTIDGKYSTVKFTVGQKNMIVQRKYDFSGIPETIETDVEPFVYEGVVYVPLRFAAEALGAKVEWDSATGSVYVYFDKEEDIIPVEKPAEYEEIDISGISENDGLYSWVQENRINKGIYTKILDNRTYVLIASGEKPTGGYSVEIESATVVYPGRIYLTAVTTEPEPGAMVIQMITYPCKLIAIEGEFSVDGIIDDFQTGDGEEMKFETVSPAAIAADEELSAWVGRLYRQAGIHCTDKDGYVYVLVSAGMKNTGGYSVTVDRVVKETSGDVYIYATVHSPDPDMFVTQVITWPYTVIRFEGTAEEIHGNIQDSYPGNNISVF